MSGPVQSLPAGWRTGVQFPLQAAISCIDCVKWRWLSSGISRCLYACRHDNLKSQNFPLRHPPSPSSSLDRVWSLSSVLLCEGARFSWCSAKVCECVELCLRILYKCFRVVLRHVNSLNGCECWALPGLSLWKCRMVRTGWGVLTIRPLTFLVWCSS